MKPLPAELEAKIDEVKSWMLAGDQRRVAEKAGVSESRVSEQLNKRKPLCPKVLDAAIEVMNKNKARFEIKETSLLMKVAI